MTGEAIERPTKTCRLQEQSASENSAVADDSPRSDASSKKSSVSATHSTKSSESRDSGDSRDSDSGDSDGDRRDHASASSTQVNSGANEPGRGSGPGPVPGSCQGNMMVVFVTIAPHLSPREISNVAADLRGLGAGVTMVLAPDGTTATYIRQFLQNPATYDRDNPLREVACRFVLEENEWDWNSLAIFAGRSSAVLRLEFWRTIKNTPSGGYIAIAEYDFHAPLLGSNIMRCAILYSPFKEPPSPRWRDIAINIVRTGVRWLCGISLGL